MGFRAGAAEVKITPPVGVDLCGYGGRPGPSVGVHDDLWGHALVLDDGPSRVALIALDLLSTDFAFDAELRRAVADAASLSPDDVLVNFSHTHAGPMTAGTMRSGAADAAYVAGLPSRVAGAAAEAAARLTPARLRYGTAPARVGINRRERTADGSIILGRNPSGIVDEEMRALVVESDGERPLAVVFHQACHGTTLKGDNLLITAEWMGAACARLRERFDAVPLFLQGCAGQTNPDCRESTFAEVERLGALAYHAVVRAVVEARPLAGAPLRAAREQIALPLQDPPDVETARAEVAQAERDVEEARRAEANPYWVRALEGLVPKTRRTLELAARGESDLTLPFAVHALAIGDLALVGLSGEVFLEFGRRIAAESPFPQTWALGYTDGCQCYVPTAEALAEGGYEGADSFRWYGTLPFAPHAGDEMAAAAVRLLHELKEKP